MRIRTTPSLPPHALSKPNSLTSSFHSGILWGLILALFHGGTQVSHAMFENKPFGLFVLESGSITVSLILSGGMLGALFGSA